MNQFQLENLDLYNGLSLLEFLFPKNPSLKPYQSEQSIYGKKKSNIWSTLILLYLYSLASPVHIVGGSHPQMAQPSKVLNLFPRPSGTEGLVLDHMGSLAGNREDPKSYPLAPKSGMTPPSY